MEINDLNGKIICDRCGELIYRRSIHVENLNLYDTGSKQAYINSLVKLENVSEEVATSWAEHGLFELCTLKTRNCLVCNMKLETWQAKMCLKCGADFEPWGKFNVKT
ncbi:hypothetical protein [Methylomonas sp. HYX-M1]|uniref:hypothetical protein n=1 Tax=Methylomonas sp. HYX-M1 TaxID=3139307 RepID=UPI00345B683D